MSKRIFLSGGLGNQLFQWSFAHTLTAIGNSRVTMFGGYDRRFKFGHQKVLSSFCNHVSYRFAGPIRSNFYPLIAKYATRLNLAKVYVEADSQLLDENWNLFKSFYGYFQSSDFVDLNSVMELDSFLRTLPTESKHYKEGYVFLHLRRTDYLKEFHGYISLETYLTQLNSIHTSLPIVISSDDYESALRFQTSIPNSVALDPAVFTSWETLSMMANATILIGANSSLSWWGARLATYRGQKAMLPKFWFKADGIDLKRSNNLFFPGIDFYENLFE